MRHGPAGVPAGPWPGRLERSVLQYCRITPTTTPWMVTSFSWT
jgi:hypothetical protein